MKVEFEPRGDIKVVLDIIFQKTNPGERRRKNKRELIDTTCIIFRGGQEIAYAVARQSPLDNYSKIIGKKVALARAIANIEFSRLVPQVPATPEAPEALEAPEASSREMRRHIWDVFRQTFGRWN